MASSEPVDLADPEQEHAIIGSLLSDNSGFGKLGQLQPDDFADPILGAVLAAALDLRGAARRVDLLSLQCRRRRAASDGVLEPLGSPR
jgi:hypothetical protein